MTIKCADLQGCPCIKKARALASRLFVSRKLWHEDSLSLSNSKHAKRVKYIQIYSDMMFVAEGDDKKF